MTEVKQFDRLPEGLLDIPVQELHTLIPEPALFHLPGRKPEPLFVSVLLHGNEPTGFLALQRLLRKYREQSLPRALALFFGNTQAARQQSRRLDGQPDFNRIWPGTLFPESPETRWAAEITAIMRRRGVFASIDVHNNTGLNPHYACINKLDNTFLQLGRIFGRLLVYFTHPKGIQSGAFSAFCPALTLECGRSDQQYGTEHALQFIDSCLHLAEIPSHAVAKQDIDLYHTVAQVTVPEEVAFSFNDTAADLCLSQDLERMNFSEIPPGTVLGRVTDSGKLPVLARDNDGKPVTEQFFALDDHDLVISRAAMPSMLTLNEKVIRQDCLCYLMERINL